MYRNQKVAVIVPAYNEEKFIVDTIKGVPDYVDLIIVVDDKSTDATRAEVKKILKNNIKLKLIESKINSGVGGSILQGHDYAVENKVDIMVVMAGDNQMDPQYLPKLLNKLIDNNAAYVKGNRFFHTNALKSMPRVRLIGNIIITLLSKFSTGYWTIGDPLNGYTALTSDAYVQLDKSSISKRYDFELSILIALGMINADVKDVYIPAKYGKEKSDINLFRDSVTSLKTLIKGFIRRIYYKHLVLNFSLIPIFYLLGFMFFVSGIAITIMLVVLAIGPASPSSATAIFTALNFIVGTQFFLQAILIDIQSEP